MKSEREPAHMLESQNPNEALEGVLIRHSQNQGWTFLLKLPEKRPGSRDHQSRHTGRRIDSGIEREVSRGEPGRRFRQWWGRQHCIMRYESTGLGIRIDEACHASRIP
jgi:hypothetical protein